MYDGGVNADAAPAGGDGEAALAELRSLMARRDGSPARCAADRLVLLAALAALLPGKRLPEVGRACTAGASRRDPHAWAQRHARHLAAGGLARLGPHGAVRLTEKGRSAAAALGRQPHGAAPPARCCRRCGAEAVAPWDEWGRQVYRCGLELRATAGTWWMFMPCGGRAA